MGVLHAVALLLVMVAGTGVVLNRRPVDQAVAMAFFGLALSLLFVLFQAPDAALSQLVVGGVVEPLLLLLAITRVERERS